MKFREEVLQRLEIRENDTLSEERFSHGYYQGLLVEIGKYEGQTTFVPAQDKDRRFIDKPLSQISDYTALPRSFTGNDSILSKARTVDVIWFNKRTMPTAFFEVEHTTNITNSLDKFYELQDFYARFYIVADQSREREFRDKVSRSGYSDIKERVQFLSYEKVAGRYSVMEKGKAFRW